MRAQLIMEMRKCLLTFCGCGLNLRFDSFSLLEQNLVSSDFGG
jgi:hypothetical protein